MLIETNRGVAADQLNAAASSWRSPVTSAGAASETCQRHCRRHGMLCATEDPFAGLVDRFRAASAGFERRLRAVRPDQWTRSTPCTDWDVRALVNHMTRGNFNYVGLVNGGTAAEFLRLRDANALGADPVGAYVRSVRACAEAFGHPGALERILDYPLGRVTGRQALAVRTTDTTIHNWDLARAIGIDDDLEPDLVRWIDDHLDQIYAGLAETPTAPDTTHRFFAAPGEPPPDGAYNGRAFAMP